MLLQYLPLSPNCVANAVVSSVHHFTNHIALQSGLGKLTTNDSHKKWKNCWGAVSGRKGNTGMRTTQCIKICMGVSQKRRVTEIHVPYSWQAATWLVVVYDRSFLVQS